LNSIFYGLKDSRARDIISRSIADIKNSKIDLASFSFNHDPSFEIPQGQCKILILWEPSAVMPWQYQERNLRKFDLVIPMSCWRAENLDIEKYAFHPYDFESAKRVSPFMPRVRKIVMINSAKYSAGRTSYYGLRRRTSRYLHEKHNLDYSLYGNGWQMSKVMEIRKRGASLRNSLIAREKISLRELTSDIFYSYPEYSGWIEDKFEILSQFEISLVIENESDWVTEKVFDSLVAGAVPLYIGPDLSEKFPKLNSCLLLADPNPESIYKRIVEVSENELEEKRYAIDSFLDDNSQEGIGFWSHANQWTRVANIARNYLESL
jgi:hypothetical protein